ERPVQFHAAGLLAQHRHARTVARLQPGIAIDEHAARLGQAGARQQVQGLVAQVAVVALVQDVSGHRRSLFAAAAGRECSGGTRAGSATVAPATNTMPLVRTRRRPMAVSTFDIYKIGIGPSSSHTVGPMRAAARFVERRLAGAGLLPRVARVHAEVFGSLALTGRGHGTDKALLLGLEGHLPHRIDPDLIPATLARIRGEGRVRLGGSHPVEFDEKRDLVMNKRQKLPHHPNGMRFTAFNAAGQVLATQDYYSVGGGFVVNQDEAARDRIVADTTPLPHPFASGDELLQRAEAGGCSIARLMLDNERVWRSDAQITDGLRELWSAMQSCVARGIREEGTLPGGLNVPRRAPALHRELSSRPEAAMRDPLTVLDWVNLYALAVNEENAAGGRVVTAPTNGAAGIIPAVLHYYDRFCPGSSEQGVFDFLLTAAAVGILYKENASISGAEVGC